MVYVIHVQMQADIIKFAELCTYMCKSDQICKGIMLSHAKKLLLTSKHNDEDSITTFEQFREIQDGEQMTEMPQPYN